VIKFITITITNLVSFKVTAKNELLSTNQLLRQVCKTYKSDLSATQLIAITVTSLIIPKVAAKTDLLSTNHLLRLVCKASVRLKCDPNQLLL
jgi:hypothetical protein